MLGTALDWLPEEEIQTPRTLAARPWDTYLAFLSLCRPRSDHTSRVPALPPPCKAWGRRTGEQAGSQGQARPGKQRKICWVSPASRIAEEQDTGPALTQLTVWLWRQKTARGQRPGGDWHADVLPGARRGQAGADSTAVRARIRICHLLAPRLRANHLTSLHLNFFLCKTRS